MGLLSLFRKSDYNISTISERETLQVLKDLHPDKIYDLVRRDASRFIYKLHDLNECFHWMQSDVVAFNHIISVLDELSDDELILASGNTLTDCIYYKNGKLDSIDIKKIIDNTHTNILKYDIKV